METESEHKKLFELCYEQGDKELTMGGVPIYLREAYRKYYARRKENEQGNN